MLRAMVLYQEILMTFRKLEIQEIALPGGKLSGVKVDANDPRDIIQLQALVKTLSNGAETALEDIGIIPGGYTPTQSIKTSKTALNTPELAKKFFLMKSHLSEATKMVYTGTAEEFSKFIRGKTLDTINADDITAYQEHLAGKGINPRTIDSKIGHLRSMFNYGIKQGYYFGSNPAALRAIVSKKQKLKSGYVLFELEELKTLFSIDKLDGMKKEQEKWVPILGLLTGCRIGEICSLTIRDIHTTSNGIRYIRITDAKTVAGIRDIPLHPIVDKLGWDKFLKYKTDKLFPRFKDIAGRGNGAAASKAFSRHMQRCNIQREKLVFHSLRKTLNDWLLKQGMPYESRCQFIGHDIDDTNVAIYSAKFTVDELAELAFPRIEKLAHHLWV